MPEPNLPPLHLNMGESPVAGMVNVQELHRSLPELPQETRQKLIDNFDLTQDIAAILLVSYKTIFKLQFVNLQLICSRTKVNCWITFTISNHATLILRPKP